MPIKTLDLGPGSLTIGAAPLQIAAQVTSCRVDTSENVASSEAVPVLSGEEREGSDRVTFTHALVANLFQDLDAAGIVHYSFLHAGEWQPVVFIPSTADGGKVEGQVSIVPITIGGDITGTAARRGDPARADINFRMKPNTGDTIADMFTPGA